jgi:hypothetical protein
MTEQLVECGPALCGPFSLCRSVALYTWQSDRFGAASNYTVNPSMEILKYWATSNGLALCKTSPNPVWPFVHQSLYRTVYLVI